MLVHPKPGATVEETSEGAIYRLTARSTAWWKLRGLLLVPGGLLMLWLGGAMVRHALADPEIRREGWFPFLLILGLSPVIFEVGVLGILHGLWLVAGVDEIVPGPSRIGMRRRVGPMYLTKWRRRGQVRRITLVEDEARSDLGCRLRIEAEGSRPADSGSRHPRESLGPLARRLADRCREKPAEFDGFFDASPKVSLAEESADPMHVRDRDEPPVGSDAILARDPDGLRIELPAPGFRRRETIGGLVGIAFWFGMGAGIPAAVSSGAMGSAPRIPGWVDVMRVVFGGGVFLISWGLGLVILLAFIGRARRSYTLTASPSGLTIDHSGPNGRGRIGRSWPRPGIRALGARVKECKSEDSATTYVTSLRITTRDGETTHWLEDRPKAELEWIATTLRHALSMHRA